MNHVAVIGNIQEIKENIIIISSRVEIADDKYEQNIIPVEVYNGIYDGIKKYCHIGDVVGVRGRIQTKDGKNMKILAEKVTFLSTKKEDK